MLNKLSAFMRSHGMVRPGDRVFCAVSGGADSVALLFALYLLKEKLSITLEAAHFNHHLRGAESDRDEAFVRELCGRFDIPLTCGGAQVTAGPKGLEAAAREARYAFLRALPGTVATAHTADDNAETVLMHLVRGTGLKGLGAIAPVSGNVIRPMLDVTRSEVEQLLEEYHLPHIEDSSNDTDAFLRNRLRHHVMPLLQQENPCLCRNLSAMALRLRQDEAVLDRLSQLPEPDVTRLREMAPALRSRALERILKSFGVKEPEAEHIAQLEALVLSDRPSAGADFPGGVRVARNYNRLERVEPVQALPCVVLKAGVCVDLPAAGLRVSCVEAVSLENTPEVFTVPDDGKTVLRSRQTGDVLRRSGGSKSLKKLFIDRKIPASRRQLIPVVANESGVIGVYGIGSDPERQAQSLPALQIRFEKTDR